MLTRDPSISDYLPLFEEPPPPPLPGSQENPISLDDTDQGSHQPQQKPRGKDVAEAQAVTTSRRSLRLNSQASTTRRASSGSRGKPYPATSPSSSPTSTVPSSRGAQRKAKTFTAVRKALKTPARKRAAANKFAPSVSSPLSQVAFTASTLEKSLSPTPPPEEIHSRWYIPPRKHSTGSISVTSESSSDSDSEPDDDDMYYSR
ncbi:hypothetical protein LXA43DRAFT_984279 [Ganoderma leucocontextum]|nr:hypothetical protein LXA43DRAFT_984279 [Ganoderma leucocontextum]